MDAIIRSNSPHASVLHSLNLLSSEVINLRLNLKNVSSFHCFIKDSGTKIRTRLTSPRVISSIIARYASMVLPSPTEEFFYRIYLVIEWDNSPGKVQ